MGTRDTRPERPTPEGITKQLVKLLERGAYAEVLLRDAPNLVSWLCPQSDTGLTDMQRAKEAENVIKEAIDEMAPDYKENVEEVLWRIFAFRKGRGLRGPAQGREKSMKMTRRESACRVLADIKPETFRVTYQRPYLEALAGILYDKYALRTEQK